MTTDFCYFYMHKNTWTSHVHITWVFIAFELIILSSIVWKLVLSFSLVGQVHVKDLIHTSVTSHHSSFIMFGMPSLEPIDWGKWPFHLQSSTQCLPWLYVCLLEWISFYLEILSSFFRSIWHHKSHPSLCYWSCFVSCRFEDTERREEGGIIWEFEGWRIHWVGCWYHRSKGTFGQNAEEVSENIWILFLKSITCYRFLIWFLLFVFKTEIR